ncbi:MAG: T9SS type A sorting domain-containing protein [Flavobacteriales bacterium]
MEIDNLGRIVLASYGSGAAGIWRFHTDGSTDASFNYTLDLSPYFLDNWILDIAIAQDNSIYVQPNTYASPNYLFKLLGGGTLDTGFGTGGHMILNDDEPLQFVAPDELLIEPGGGLIVLASAFDGEAHMTGKFLVRLDEHGVIDDTFNPGIQPIDDHGYDLRINFHCATLQHDGKVLSMDQVVKWRNGELFGYAPLITRFNNEKGAVTAAVNEAGPRVDDVFAFPNPTMGTVFLRAPSLEVWQNATVIITDGLGAVARQGKLVNGRIDLSALPPGVYSCMVKHAGGSLHARVVKE